MELFGIWGNVYNPNFNYGEFAIIKNKAGFWGIWKDYFIKN